MFRRDHEAVWPAPVALTLLGLFIPPGWARAGKTEFAGAVRHQTAAGERSDRPAM